MIGPHLLRRVKEQVEKSIPPKEETIIDVELTTLQKKYYRAIFERNRQFLYKVRIAPSPLDTRWGWACTLTSRGLWCDRGVTVPTNPA